MTASSGNLLKYPALIDGKEAEVIFDCGAEKSVLSLNLARKFNITIHPSKFHIELSSGAYENVIGETKDTTIILAGIETKITFLVT